MYPPPVTVAGTYLQMVCVLARPHLLVSIPEGATAVQAPDKRRKVTMEKENDILGSGWTNPFERYARQIWMYISHLEMGVKIYKHSKFTT